MITDDTMEDTKPAVWTWIDTVADRFEAAWKATGSLDIVTYIDGRDSQERCALISELLKIDAEYRLSAGLSIDMQSWLNQVPELTSYPQVLNDLSDYVNNLRNRDHADAAHGPSVQNDAPNPTTATEPSRVTGPERIGRFEVLEEVGSGSFGVVFRARDPQLGREVAVKVLHAGSLVRPQVRERFVREARSVAQLQHEAIAPIYDFG